MATFTTIVSKPVTFTDSTDVVNLTAHGFNTNVAVKFSSILNTTGISVDTFYYVISDTANTFKLSNSINGSVLPLTTNGSGTLSAVSRSELTNTCSSPITLQSISFKKSILYGIWKKFSSVNTVIQSSFKFFPTSFKFSGIPNILESISFEWISPTVFKDFSGIPNILESISFEWISPTVFKDFSGVNTNIQSSFKFLPEIFKFSGISFSTFITYKYIPLIDRWKKFSGISKLLVPLSIKNLTLIDKWKKFSGISKLLVPLSIILPPNREIGTRFTFAGISKLLVPLSIILPPNREIGTRFTFAGLGTIIASTAKISDFSSTLKYSSSNTLSIANVIVSDFSQKISFSAMNIITISNIFISDFSQKISFSAMNTINMSNIYYIQSEVYAKFSSLNIVKVITTKAKYWKDDILPQLPVIKQLIEFWS